MAETIIVPKKEYEALKHKAELLDSIIETEELSAAEVKELEEARLGKSLTEAEFLKKHPELSENV